MENTELERLRARIEHLERRQRAGLLRWCLSLVAVGVMAFGVQQAASQNEILRVRGLEVTDASGIVRIGLNVQQDGTAEILLAEAAGRGRMWLNVRPDGTPGVIIADAGGRGRIWFVASPDRPSGVILSDGMGRGRVWLNASPDGSPGLVLVDNSGKVRFQAP
ncbi:MAG: hypothetical protein RDU83_03335 [bacterium]|nr:hypothetical protein [bacterium]